MGQQALVDRTVLLQDLRFLTGVLFAVSITGFFETSSGWVRLTLIRDVSRIQWAVSRLMATLVVAVGFLAVLLACLAVTVIVGSGSPPLITGLTLCGKLAFGHSDSSVSGGP